MSKPKSPPASRAAVSNVLLVEVPPQFIALCGIATLRCDDDNRLVPLEGAAS